MFWAMPAAIIIAARFLLIIRNGTTRERRNGRSRERDEKRQEDRSGLQLW
jgi:hypothetical protein